MLSDFRGCLRDMATETRAEESALKEKDKRKTRYCKQKMTKFLQKHDVPDVVAKLCSCMTTNFVDMEVVLASTAYSTEFNDDIARPRAISKNVEEASRTKLHTIIGDWAGKHTAKLEPKIPVKIAEAKAKSGTHAVCNYNDDMALMKAITEQKALGGDLTFHVAPKLFILQNYLLNLA